MSEETLHPASAELETQLRRLESIVDPAARSTATDLIAALLRFHSAALERMLELIGESETNASILAGFDQDPLIRSVLLVHDLHPDPLSARVRRAIADVEPMLKKRGAAVEVVRADEERVLVRITGGEPGRGTFAPAVEKVIRSLVPEAVDVRIEDTAAAPASGFVPLETLGTTLIPSFANPSPK